MERNLFVKQAVILASAGLIARLLGFIYRMPLMEIIGDSGTGIYGAGYTIYNFLLILSSAGLPAAISKMVSERRILGQYENAHKVFRVALRVALISGSVAACVLWLGAEYIANLVHSPKSYYAILTLTPTVFIVAILSVFRGYFQGMQNTIPTALSQIIEQLFNAVFTVILAYIFVKNSLELGVAGATAATGIGAFVGLLVMIGIYTLAKPVIHRKIKRDKTKVVQSTSAITKELLKTAVPIIAGTAIFSISGIIDTRMVMELLKVGGATQDQAYELFGLFSGKYILLSTLPVAIATSLATAVVPDIAASRIENDMEAVRYKINLGLRSTMMFSIPAAVGLGVLGEQILIMLFPSYPEGGALLSVGALSIIFLAISQIATGMLQGLGMVGVPVIAAVCGALIKIPLNYYLVPIPEINVIGAVLSTTACYLVAASINLTVLSLKMRIMPDFIGVFVKPLFASILMGVAAYASYAAFYIFIQNNTVGVILSILVGMIVYFVFMLIFRGIEGEDIRMLPFGKKIEAFMKTYNLT